MKAVIDSNVVVAGLLSPFGPCGQIVRMLSSGQIDIRLDARILSEYREVLHRPKFGFDPHAIDALLDYIEFRGQAIASAPLVEHLPDLDDEPFLEVALSGGADHLVTGNLVHFPPESRASVTVLSPSDFLKAYSAR